MILRKEVWCLVEAPSEAGRLLDSEPALNYTISAAKESQFIDRIIVSSEDPAIRELAARQNILVQSKCPSFRQTTHEMVAKLGIGPEIIVTLDPLFPFRTADTIDKMIEICATSWLVFGVKPVDVTMGDVLVTVRNEVIKTARISERVPPLYERIDNISCYKYFPENSMWNEQFDKFLAYVENSELQRFRYSDRYYLLKDRKMWIRIDSEENWQVAERILRHEGSILRS
jgi:CMP-N-acetylneuraminic acid synthetase